MPVLVAPERADGGTWVEIVTEATVRVVGGVVWITETRLVSRTEKKVPG